MGILGRDLLLDSHILLRWDGDIGALSLAQWSAIKSPTNRVFVSAASAWELGIKSSKRKLVLTRPVSAMLLAFGFVQLPVSIAHAERAAGLPMLHSDPFDRLIAAQALIEGMVLVTSDPWLSQFGPEVLVR